MKKYLLLFTCILSLGISSQAQDIHFSQFYENAIMRNPALTGIFSGDYKVGANYRTQWSNISVPFRTLLFSAETRVIANKSVGDYFSFGVTGTYDKAGTINFNSMQVYPAINYNKSLEDKRNSYLSVGFAAGYIQRTIDFTQATFSSQYVNGAYSSDNLSGENLNNVTLDNFDLSAGISLNSSFGPQNIVNYYVGVAAYHLNKPQHTFQENNPLVVLQTKFNVNAGFSWTLNRQFGITSHWNYSKQGTTTQIIGGGLVSWKNPSETSENFKIYAGAFIRFGDAIIPTFKLDYHVYSLTFSYDVNNSQLRTASSGAGGYELSLFVKGSYKKSKYARGGVPCPRFDHMLPGSLGGTGSSY